MERPFLLYKLEGREPVPCTEPGEWSAWYEGARSACQVALDVFFDGAVRVSTTFLGTAHLRPDGQAPLLFETMIFGGKAGGFQSRYATWKEAEEGHAEAVRFAVEAGPP